MNHNDRPDPRAGVGTRLTWLPLIFFAWALSLLAPSAQAGVGGGFTNAGLDGQYFNNANFTAPASFTRRDVRLDFGVAGNLSLPPGGSPSPGFRDLGANNWSAKWTGQFIPRFSETYTFCAVADDAVIVKVRKAGTTGWTTVINQTAYNNDQEVTGTFGSAFVANTVYDIEVDFAQTAGLWGLNLKWYSPSTPKEVIEPNTQAAFNTTYRSVMYANQIWTGRDEWDDVNTGQQLPSSSRDADGWPKTDASSIIWEGGGFDRQGAYKLQFKGQATVGIAFALGTFSVGGVSQGYTLPAGIAYNAASGEGYNSSTNTTTATLNILPRQDNLILTFTNTKRLATDSPGTGFTNVKLMKPTAIGGTTSYDPSTLFTTGMKNAAANFVTMRWLSANFSNESDWANVSPLSYSFGANTLKPTYAEQDFGDHFTSWEVEIEFSNETGKDLHITVPTLATPDYVAKLVNLIRYGADQNFNPYTSVTATPYYPPLNPNLAVYAEWGNEQPWGAFPGARYLTNVANAAAAANGAEWNILNYDNISNRVPDGNGNVNPAGTLAGRVQALKTQEMSDAFRAVYGDAGMGTHVRVLLEDRYGDPNIEPYFLDHYFNKTDPASTYTGTTHPLSYYIWGGGGATYYDANNATGSQTATVFTNGGFESNSIAAGTTSSTVTGWTVSGNAGIYRNVTHTSGLASAPALGTSGNSFSAGTSFGYKFTVGSQNIGIYELGRWNQSGNTQGHTIRVFNTSGQEVAETSVDASKGTAGGFQYSGLWSPIRLTANTTYYIVSDENNNGDHFYGNDTGLSSTSAFTINSDAYATNTGSGWTFTTGGNANHGYGPVDFKYTTNLDTLGFPSDAPFGTNGAFIGDTGSISQSVTFSSDGQYAIAFWGAWGPDSRDGPHQVNPLRYFIDNVEITPGNFKYDQVGDPYVTSGYGINPSAYNFRTTIATHVTAGAHTFKILGTGTTGQYAFVDNLSVSSVDALYNAGVPNTGYGGTPGSLLNNEAGWVKTFGLHRVAYEGGWALNASPQVGGGDSNTYFSHWAQWSDPRAADASKKVLTYYAQSGGDTYTFGTFLTWPDYDTDNAGNYPVLQGIIAFNNSPKVEPNNGIAVPAVLKPSTITLSENSSGGTIAAAPGFVAWNIITPVSGNYTFSLSSTGGSPVILVDDATVVTQGGSVYLTKGIHSAMVRTSSGSVTVNSLTITEAGAPASPTLSATDADGAVSLTWSSVSGATDYVVSYGTASGVYTLAPIDAGTATSLTVSGLTNGTAYYFVVSAYNATGQSLPSNEVSSIPLGNNQNGILAAWEFTNYTGQETTASPVIATSRAVVSSLNANIVTSGSGLTVSGYVKPNTFGIYPYGNVYGQTLVDSISQNQYVQYTIAPVSGKSLSLNTLTFSPYFQGSNNNTPLGAGITYSTDGTNFSSGLTASGTPQGYGTPYTVDLSGQTALQGTTHTVTIRIYVYGVFNYGFSGIGDGTPANDIVLTGSFAGATQPTAATPTFSPAGGTYTAAQTVTISSSTSGASIYYTTDGSTPTTASTHYTAAISVSSSKTLKAIATASGYSTSAVGTATYTINTGGGTSLTVGNFSFEAPSLGAGQYTYTPTGATWTFGTQATNAGSGIQSNGSPWGAPNAPDGVQTAFVQQGGTISQSISGFATGTNYTLTVQAAQRSYNPGGNQSVDVYIDTTKVGTITPTSTSFGAYSVGPFTASSAGSHTLKFQGTNTTGDSSAFLDSVTLTGAAVTNTLLSQGKTATASSLENSGYTAAAAFDGNATTRWSSAYADPQWIYVDLGATKTITEVKLNWETAAGKDYVIQTAASGATGLNTDTPWTTIKTVTGNTTAGVLDYTGLSGSGRYVRMKGTARATQYGYSLFEFQVYGH